MVVILGIGLFYFVWALGWFLERLSHKQLATTHEHGSRAWYLLVGPGVALHESSHALGCIFTRTPIVEFKPINVSREEDHVILGYVKYRKPTSEIKNAIINLAPVAVSLAVLILFALGITYLVPSSQGLGGQALALLDQLIFMKNDPLLLGNVLYPLGLIGTFIYDFVWTFAGLTVVNPLFWIVAFLAMTTMFSNAPSSTDIRNARVGLKWLLIFNAIWIIVALVYPLAGFLMFGVFELLAVMFSLAVAFAAVGYGFFIMITAMSKLKFPINILPFLACVGTGAVLLYLNTEFQTILSLLAFVIVVIPLLMVKRFRK